MRERNESKSNRGLLEFDNRGFKKVVNGASPARTETTSSPNLINVIRAGAW